MRLFLFSICTALFFFLPDNAQAQYWRTLTNPLYRAHTKVNKNELVVAEKILNKRIHTTDTLNPIYWHCRTRIAESKDLLDLALFNARKSVLAIQMLQNSTELYAEFLRVYIMDAYYLDLYYRKLLYQKYNTQRSLTSTIANNKLLGYYLQESQSIASRLPLSNINRRITLPLITENINALNDTIIFNRVIETRNTHKTWEYLQGFGTNSDQLNQLPAHLKSFYLQARDSFYNWTYENVLLKHTEQDFLNFIKTYPSAPQITQALAQADELAFAQCRNAHSAPNYTQYLEKYPYGKYRKQAKMLLRYLTVVPVPFARADGKYVFVDSLKMQSWIDSAYDFAYPFCLKYHTQWSPNAATLISGCALVMKKDEFDRNQWFYLEKDGTPFNDKRYDEIRQISPKHAIVSNSNHYGLIDLHGRELLPPIFKRIFFDTLNEIGTVFNGEFWALFNKYGKRISPFEYNEIATPEDESDLPVAFPKFQDNRILVRKEKDLLVLDFEGNKHFLGSFSHITPFTNHLALATLPDSRQLLIDTSGKAQSDTFVRLSILIPGHYYQAEIQSIKPRFGVLFVNKTFPALMHLRSDIPVETAWYWNNVHFLTKTNGEWQIHSSQDSMVFKSKTVEIMSHAQTVFVQTLKKNPKSRNSPWVKKWFNPYTHNFSVATAQEIGVLQEERIVLYENSKARLFHINETPLPVFHETKSVAEVSDIREIYRINRNQLLFAKTDTSQTIIDLNGKMLFEFSPYEIEEFGSQYFIQNREDGQYLINQNQGDLLGPFHEINEEGFEGYYLVNDHKKWVWIDARKRWFGESE